MYRIGEAVMKRSKTKPNAVLPVVLGVSVCTAGLCGAFANTPTLAYAEDAPTQNTNDTVTPAPQKKHAAEPLDHKTNAADPISQEKQHATCLLYTSPSPRD